MRDVVVEKACPIAFLIVVIWYIDAPHHVLRGILHDAYMNASTSLAMLADFFR